MIPIKKIDKRGRVYTSFKKTGFGVRPAEEGESFIKTVDDDSILDTEKADLPAEGEMDLIK